MSSERRIEKLTASDDELARHLEDAQLPALLLATSHLTGDPAVLDGAPVPVQGLMAGPQGGFDEVQIADARARCFEALKKWRDAGCPEPPRPSEAGLRRLLSFVVEEARLDETLPFLLDELSLVTGGAWPRGTGLSSRATSVRCVVLHHPMSDDSRHIRTLVREAVRNETDTDIQEIRF